MIDVFLQFFPACCMFVAMAFIVIDEWDKEDRRMRMILKRGFARPVIRDEHGRALMFLEDYQMPCMPVGRLRRAEKR